MTNTANSKNLMNLQDSFLNHVRKENLPVVIYLVNGFQIRGLKMTGNSRWCTSMRFPRFPRQPTLPSCSRKKLRRKSNVAVRKKNSAQALFFFFEEVS